jgi:hypothetical protein
MSAINLSKIPLEQVSRPALPILVVILAIFVTLRFYAVFRLKRVLDKVSVSRQALHCANLLLMDF